MEEHCGGDDQHGAFGGGEVTVVRAAAFLLCLRQVHLLRERCPRGCGEPLHGRVERFGENLRRAVGVAHGPAGLPHRFGKLGDAARFGPARARAAGEFGARADRPDRLCLFERLGRRAVGVADGEDDGGQALLEAAIRVADRFAPLGRAEAGFGFEHDARAADVDNDIHPLAALAAFGAGVKPLRDEQLGELAVEQLFLVVLGHWLTLLSWHRWRSGR